LLRKRGKVVRLEEKKEPTKKPRGGERTWKEGTNPHPHGKQKRNRKQGRKKKGGARNFKGKVLDIKGKQIKKKAKK